MTDSLFVVTGPTAAVDNARAAEGSAITFIVTIPNAAPSGGVTIIGAGSDIAIDPGMAGVQNTLTFTAANWFIPQ